MVNKDKQDRLDRFFKSTTAHPNFGKTGFAMNEDVDFYGIWDWMVTNKKGVNYAALKFGVHSKNITNWIKRTEQNIEDTKRDKMIDGVLHWQCSGCEEIKEVNSHNFSPQKNERGFRSKCKTCMNNYYKKTKNEKTTTE